MAFVHPDLGIGGAERLVVDAALALQAAGHEVAMFTARHSTAGPGHVGARHERGHCFEETRCVAVSSGRWSGPGMAAWRYTSSATSCQGSCGAERA